MGLFIGGLLSVALLSGCTEADLNATLNQEAGAEGNELSDEYVESAFDELNESRELPENVKNGTVSEEMYKESLRYINDFQEYDQNMFGYLDKINKDSSLKDDAAFLDEFRESMNAYEVFLKGFHISPKTEADFEINSNLSDTIMYTEYAISSIRQHFDTKEDYHLSSLEEDLNKATTSYNALGNSLMKYKLYTE